jgi:hypothetical protein
MSPVTRAILERLRRGLLSRNRNFRFFRHPEAKDALRTHRYLRSVELDLLRHAQVPGARVEVVNGNGAGWVTIRLEVPHLHARRTCRLTEAEYGVLLANPDVSTVLRDSIL